MHRVDEFYCTPGRHHTIIRRISVVGAWVHGCTSMSAAVDVGRLAIEVTDRGRAAPKCGVASA